MKYYTCANTSDGVVDFTEENIFDIENKIELRCKNDCIRSYVLKLLAEKLGEYEEIVCHGSRDMTSGIILRDKNTAIVSECKEPDKVVDLDVCFDVPDYSSEITSLYESMFKAYGEAKKIHDDWEKIYIGNMDYSSLDNYCKGMIEKLVKTQSVRGTGKTYKRFFGTSTVEGPVNYIDNITENVNKRYFIKGRPGTGKSTFLKKLSAALRERGFDAEEYYCSFDKKSYDMVVSRELSFCVFDSTAPHEKFPERENDEILDFYIEAGLSGVDEKYEKELYDIKNSYDAKIKEGMEFFKKAWSLKEATDKKMLEMVKVKDLYETVKNIFD